MEKLIKSFFVVITFVLGVISVNAQEPISKSSSYAEEAVNVHMLPSVGKLRIIFINPSKKNVLVVFKNDRKEVIFSDASSLDSYKRDLNLKDLPSGIYSIHVKGRKIDYSSEVILKDRVTEKSIELINENNVIALKEKSQ